MSDLPKMGDCHLPLHYPNQKCDDKFCKYSYSSWCPTCERSSPRRRSRSETSEPCRRKCREMKAPNSKKSNWDQECENMDLEFEAKECWYEPKECCRVRSNLCELPTSYITNNHQTPSKLSSEKTSEKLEVECLDRTARTHEQSLKYSSVIQEKLNKNQQELYDVLHKIQVASHNNPSPKSQLDNHSSDFNPPPFKTPLQPVVSGGPSSYDIAYDTCTYFDKVRDTNGFHERYIREIEKMREKLSTSRGTSRKLPEIPDSNKSATNGCYLKETVTLQEKFAREIAGIREKIEMQRMTIQRQVTEVKTEETTTTAAETATSGNKWKIGVKTGRRLSSGKLKKMRPKSGTPLAQSLEDSECSASDESEADDIDGDEESESLSEELGSGPASETDTAVIQNGGEGYNIEGWPVRISLFPNIPPYIRFNTHDAELPIKLPVGRRVFKWKLSTITPLVVRKTLTNTGFVLVRSEFSRDSNQWLGTWGKHMKSPMFKTLKDTQKLNHFPGTFQLGRKDRLWRNFQRLINKHGYKEFGFIPQTFILPQELKLLKQNWEYKNGNGTDAWIIKPPASARGVGIKVINKWSQLPKKMSLVVQRYISNPYLINGSKFDLRLYVLITSFNPLRIYLYPEGLARFASAKYSEDAKDLKDRYMHLTNYSINKLSSTYTTNEDANACQGHKWTLTKLFEYMEAQGVDTKALWKNLQQLVVKTIITGEAPIYTLCEEHMSSRYNCYELFGVDVLLDEKLKPWLLEVNISPSLHSASPLDAHVKGPLVQLLFDLAQFHFPPRLSQTIRQIPPCYEPKLYRTGLTKTERSKHDLFVQYDARADYIDDILTNLTGDDVRRLTQAEDEFTVKGRFERIFPTAQTHKYLNFMEPRYYNRLFDAWETKYEKNRQAGISVLRSLCADKVHLKVAPPGALSKNLPSMIPGVLNLQPSKEGQSRPLTEVMQEVSIGSSPSSDLCSDSAQIC